MECVWPAVLEAARRPFESASWCAAMAVVMRRAAGGDLARVRRLGRDRFVAAVRRELARGARRGSCLRIVRAVFASARRRGRDGRRTGTGRWSEPRFVMADWRSARARLVEVETRMVGVLDELELTELVVLDPRAVRCRGGGGAGRDRRPGPVRSARGRWSSTPGSARATTPPAPIRARAGSPGAAGRELRVAAWRAGWGAQHVNPVLAARVPAPDHAASTTASTRPRPEQRARRRLLRWLHTVVVRRVPWDPEVAAGRRAPAADRAERSRHHDAGGRRCRLTPELRSPDDRAGGYDGPACQPAPRVSKLDSLKETPPAPGHGDLDLDHEQLTPLFSQARFTLSDTAHAIDAVVRLHYAGKNRASETTRSARSVHGGHRRERDQRARRPGGRRPETGRLRRAVSARSAGPDGAGLPLPRPGRLRRRYATALRAALDPRASASPGGTPPRGRRKACPTGWGRPSAQPTTADGTDGHRACATATYVDQGC